MRLQMTEHEIVQSYMLAKKRGEQIMILADLNCCQKEDIIEVLKKNGVEVNNRVFNGGNLKHPKKDVVTTQPKKEETKSHTITVVEHATGKVVKEIQTKPEEVIPATAPKVETKEPMYAPFTEHKDFPKDPKPLYIPDCVKTMVQDELELVKLRISDMKRELDKYEAKFDELEEFLKEVGAYEGKGNEYSRTDDNI